MFAGLRKHLTYANVVSSICLFVVLGGAAYAATALPGNSVGPKQLRDNAVSSPKVKDRSLLAKDFKTGQLPRGAPGEIGPSAGYTAFKADATNCGQAHCQTTLPNVPSGAYAVFAKVTADARFVSGKVATKVTCTLTAGADSDTATAALTQDTSTSVDARVQTLPLQLVHAFSGTGNVTLACTDSESDAVGYYDVKITAIKLGRVSSVEGSLSAATP
jgi:hypothetical protein